MSISIEEAIDKAIQAEKATEKLYLGLEHKFINHPEVAQFWRQFAQDEIQHIEWLINFKNGLGKSDLEKMVDLQTQDLLYLVNLFSAEKALAGIRNLADAFIMVSDLENGETDAIFRFLIDNFEVDKQIRDLLVSQLELHISRLSTNLPLPYRNFMARQAIEVS